MTRVDDKERQGDEQPERSRQGEGERNSPDDHEGQHAPGTGERKPKAPSKPFYKRPVLMTILVIVLIAGGIGALLYWLHARHFETTDDAFIEGHVIPISPQVSAYVTQVLIDDNTHVTKGQLMVTLNQKDFLAAQLQARGNLAAAQGRLEDAKAQVAVDQANIVQAQAEVVVAEANSENANSELRRVLSVVPAARSQQQLDNAQAAQAAQAAQVKEAQAKLESAKAELAEAKTAVAAAQGNVDAAKGALDQANLNLSYCNLYADCDGMVTRKDVEPGMYVQTGQVLFSLVPTDVWVIANFKETKLDLLREGQGVEISVDAYPGRKLYGRVQSIQNGTGSRFALLPPENATGNYVKIVQRVPVKIVLNPGQNDDPQHLLAPGMSVEPSVRVR